MNRQLLKRLFLGMACAIAITAASCKKTAGTEPFDNDPVATRTLRYLTQMSWRETAIEYRKSDGTWVAKPLSPVTLSQVTTFKPDGTFTVVSGSTASTGGYQIIGDNTQLAINRSTTYFFYILDDNTMQIALEGQLSYADPSSGITTTYYGMRQTYVH
jgi:hypothetical protein